MAVRFFDLSISPAEVLNTLIGEMDGDLLHHQYYPLSEDRGMGFTVFERFYRRINQHIVWVIHMQNLEGHTKGTLICSATRGPWNAALGEGDGEEYMDEVMGILDEYIVE
ncbi:MAG: hypothetical protein AB2421_03250 [Thermotaleaceae bacterium]